MKRPILILFTVLIFCACKSPEPRVPEMVKSGSFLKASAERNKKLNEEESYKIKELISKQTDKDFRSSSSGFWYAYNHKIDDDTITPDVGDIVNFDYSVSDLYGNTIYKDLNSTYIIDKQELFTGLREGLKLMKAKEEVTFIFPSQIAYGYYGDSDKIGTNVPLICNVTLNSIIQEDE